MALLFGLVVALIMQVAALNGPVSALAVDGDQLLIGQDERLVWATITPGDVSVSAQLDLKQGAVRAVLLQKDVIWVLTERGLTALDPARRVIDFAPGGGQRLAAKGNRIYVAALGTGVRLYTFDHVKIHLIGQIAAQAEDIAPEGANELWVAEGNAGLRLYDVSDPARPVVVFWWADLHPARLVRVSGARLFVGYANRLAALDTTNLKAPRLLGEVLLGGESAYASDLLILKAALLVGRTDLGGPDALELDSANLKTLREIGRVGESGAGDWLAVHNDELFVGSERTGLSRVRIDPTGLMSEQSWLRADASTASMPCTDLAPINPSPANLSSIVTTANLTLRWNAACPAEHYEVRINGKPVGSTSETNYPIPVALLEGTNSLSWQVVAVSGAQTVEGARWRFDIQRDGLLRPPPIERAETILYKAPPRPIPLLQTPAAVIAATCAAVVVGLLVVSAGAALIGSWFERRQVY